MDPLALVAVVGVVVALAHLALAGYLYRKTDARDVTPNLEPTTEVKADEGLVACPSCGVENDGFYRYCRNCVADISTGAAAAHGRGGAGGLGS